MAVDLAIELLKELKDETLPNILYSGATVQEEVGLRGAQTAANMIKPEIFFALRCKSSKRYDREIKVNLAN